MLKASSKEKKKLSDGVCIECGTRNLPLARIAM
jgi:ribosomal protein L40E